MLLESRLVLLLLGDREEFVVGPTVSDMVLSELAAPAVLAALAALGVLDELNTLKEVDRLPTHDPGGSGPEMRDCEIGAADGIGTSALSLSGALFAPFPGVCATSTRDWLDDCDRLEMGDPLEMTDPLVEILPGTLALPWIMTFPFTVRFPGTETLPLKKTLVPRGEADEVEDDNELDELVGDEEPDGGSDEGKDEGDPEEGEGRRAGVGDGGVQFCAGKLRLTQKK